MTGVRSEPGGRSRELPPGGLDASVTQCAAGHPHHADAKTDRATGHSEGNATAFDGNLLQKGIGLRQHPLAKREALCEGLGGRGEITD